MDIHFNPSRETPEPDATTLSDPFEVMLETEGKELLAQRYDYIANVLEEEFEETYLRFFSASILHYEVINLITLCSQLMQDTGFPQNEDSRFLRYSIIAAISDYLNE
jgi:hypothetical protein